MKIFNIDFKNIKTINILVNCIIVFILFFLISDLLSYCIIFADDTDIIKFKYINIKGFYSNGLPVSSIFIQIFGKYIPYDIFNMHPSDFKSEYFSYLESFLIIIFCFIPLKIMFLNKSDNIIYKLPVIVYLFVISFYMYLLQKSSLMLFTYDGFFRLNVPIFLFLLLFFYLIKIININNYRNYLIISSLTLLCCLSNELTCITILFGTLIYTFLSLFNQVTKKRLYLLCFTLILSIISTLVLIKLGAFTRKNPDIILNLSYLKYILKIIPVFINEYIKYMFINHFLGYILLVSQIIVLYIKTNERNSLNIVISYLSGLLIFFFALIGMGQYQYSNEANTFWVVHPDIQIMHELILLTFNLYLFGIVCKNKILKNYFLYIISVILIVSSGFYVCKNITYYNDSIVNFLKPLKENRYKTEKIIRLANLKNKTIYLDSDLFEEGYNWDLFYDYNNLEKNVIYPNNSYIFFLNNIGENITQKIIFTDKEIVEKNFKDLGGVFTEKELNNIKFNNLMDDNFILNKKI